MTEPIMGMNRLLKKINTLKKFQDAMVEPMNKSMATLEAEIKPYPAKPSSSTYIRTMTLFKRWVTRVRKTGRGVIGELINPTRYGKWVQSAADQTRTHKRTGWKTDEQVKESKRREVVGHFEEVANREVRK